MNIMFTMTVLAALFGILLILVGSVGIVIFRSLTEVDLHLPEGNVLHDQIITDYFLALCTDHQCVATP